MYTWGPRSAGLFEEKDGKKVFKDKDLEDAMVFAKDNGKSLSYNLTNQRINALGAYGNAWPYYPTYMWGGSSLSPVYAYDKPKNSADGRNFFNPGCLPNNAYIYLATDVMKDHHIWNYFGIPSVDKFWKGRDAFEKALTATMAAKDDAQFEQLWKKFSDLAVKIGATPEMLADINNDFIKSNAGYMDKIK
jgi:putative aldouronate transport system substrate-binding protein